MVPRPSGATRVVSWGPHGSPIVLVHGFVETADAFDALGPVLARAGHRIYAYDVRGFGWSARGGPYGDAPDRRQLAELIRAGGAGRCAARAPPRRWRRWPRRPSQA